MVNNYEYVLGLCSEYSGYSKQHVMPIAKFIWKANFAENDKVKEN